MNLATPLGFRDVIGDEAKVREQIRRRVQDLFARHGFDPIETPTLEAVDLMQLSGRAPSSPFKLFDSQGTLLAMRPDVTMQVARMCAARMTEESSPMRLRYTQRVFRDGDKTSTTGSREITQIGIECIGQPASEVDAEVVSLFLESLKEAGLSSICLAIASVTPLRSLLARSGAPDAWASSVLGAWHDSDYVELSRLCSDSVLSSPENSSIAPAYAEAILKLFRVRGGMEALQDARKLTEPLGCSDGIDGLQEILEALQETDLLGKSVSLLVDFSVISSFDYYTGIVFQAYAPALGSAIGSGGRYDGMLAAYGRDLPAAGFSFTLESVMASAESSDLDEAPVPDANSLKASSNKRPLRIAVPKGALNADAVRCLEQAGLDVEPLLDMGRQLVIAAEGVEYVIVRPSDAPAFVAYGAADCGICGKDSLLESRAQVVELEDLGFGECRFVVAEPRGSRERIEERYRRLGSMRIATKYPNVTLSHFAKRGIQADIVYLHGNIELAPLSGMAERIVDITATGATLRENNLEIVEDVLSSTARFFANPCSLRCDGRVVELAGRLAKAARSLDFEVVAGKAF